MLELVDHVAALTEHRDREALDIGFVQTVMMLLKPLKVGLYSVVSDAKDQRWLPMTVISAGHAAQTFSPLHADFRLLQPLQEVSHRWQCLHTLLRVEVESSPQEPGTWVTCLPLSSESNPEEAGVMEIHTLNKLTHQDHDAARRLVRVYRSMQSMFAYSERDALTGLLNRKSFDDTFYRSLQDVNLPVVEDLLGQPQSGSVSVPLRRHDAGEKFWLAMVDVDHFKKVNDQYGHQIGDEVLILVARILKSTFRGYDRIYRFGGEEFVILLRCPDHAMAMQAVERFRQAMENYPFPQVGRTTASVGLSEIHDGDTPEAACERADLAVYHAKRTGRNKVCSHAELEQQGLLQTEVKVGGVELF
jgi:diguanylate cyclase (GGDEF)-like protein